MSEIKWIKVATDLFNDEKIMLIEALPEADSILVVWMKLLCFAGKQNNGGVFMMNEKTAYTDKMLATIFRMHQDVVTFALDTFEEFGMIERVDGVITISNWNKHQSIEKKQARKDYNAQKQREYREKQRFEEVEDISESPEEDNEEAENSECVHAKSTRVQNVYKSKSTRVQGVYKMCTPKNKNKNKKENKNKNINIMCTEGARGKPTSADIDSLFDRLWELYPVKRGKDKVKAAKRRELYAIGFDELERAVGRYLSELGKDSDWRKPQNGSTFFNSGYADYLDATFEPVTRAAPNASTQVSASGTLEAKYAENAAWAERMRAKYESQ